MYRGSILMLASLVACGGEAGPAPQAVVAVAPAVEPTTAVADYKAELLGDAVNGFVMVPFGGVKWPTLDAARTSLTPVEPTDEVTAHVVVEDHGDVVEVLPLGSRDDEHCHSGTYDSAQRFKVSTFVRKRDLVPVLAEPVSFEGEDDTGYTLQAGVAVVQRAGQLVAVPHKGLAMRLPPRTKLTLSYAEVEPLPSTRRSGRVVGGYGYEPPEPIRVEPDAKLRVGKRRYRAGALTSGSRLYVDDAHRDGDDMVVLLGDRCYRLTARVATSKLRRGYGGGGGVASMGGGGFGYGVRAGLKRPPPMLHFVPEGTVLTWQQGGRAGELVVAIRTYPLKEDQCEPLKQGLVEELEVCYSPNAVERDCRDACRAEGRCDISRDGKRCIAAKAASCRASRHCEMHGRCSLKAGACIAARDADCQGSLYCRSSPQACIAYGGKCVVTPNPDCANRPICVTHGKCMADEHGACIAASQAGCRKSQQCKQDGACTLSGDRCVASSTADCRASDVCTRLGRCESGGGRCVVKHDRDCRASTACKEVGACAALAQPRSLGVFGSAGGPAPPPVYACGPGSDADCKASEACTNEQRCTRKETYGGNHVCTSP